MIVSEMPDGGERARDAILMEAVAQPGAAVVGAARAVDLAVAGLGGRRRRGVER